MELSLFDLHCDTATALLRDGASLYDNNCHVSLKKAADFSGYRQIMAIWSDKELDDEQAFERFVRVADYIRTQLKTNSFPLLENAASLPSRGAFLAVEDARILGGNIQRLNILYEYGVRFLTPVWGGESCIGGAHDTSVGLTPFGKQTVNACFSLGIVPDVSHASQKTAWEIFELATQNGRPVIASHSNAYSITPHTRNLTDDQFMTIQKLGGIVGICLCPAHLNTNPDAADIDSILKHIEHFYSLGGEDCLCLGCDLDGTSLPIGFSSLKDVSCIADLMAQHGYSDRQIEKLFYKNAENFVTKNL